MSLNASRVRLPELIDRLPEHEREITHRLATMFNEADEELYLVGGVVRDLLLQRTRTDLDFATSAEPAQTSKLGRAAGADAVFDVGAAFGTIGLVFRFPDGEESTVEITTYRSEEYLTRDRRPEVRHDVDLCEDLSRRDFTINAMALDPLDASLIDSFGGIADLEKHRINSVGDARERFDEDPLRVLRAARFAAQLDFVIGEDTREAMQDAGEQLERVSVERITAELNRLMVALAVERGLRAIQETGLIAHILPELSPMVEDDRAGGTARHKDIWEHTLLVTAQSPPRLTVRWAALLHDAAKPQTRSVDDAGEVHFFGHEIAGAGLARRLLRRLKQDKALQQRVSQLVAMHLRPSSYSPDWTDSAVRRLALEAGDAFEDLLDLAAADVTSARQWRQDAAARRVGGLREHYERLEAEWALAQLQSPLDGNELMEMFDRGPGRWIAEVKDYLRELVIDGDLDPGDKETAATLAREWMDSREVDS